MRLFGISREVAARRFLRRFLSADRFAGVRADRALLALFYKRFFADMRRNPMFSFERIAARVEELSETWEVRATRESLDGPVVFWIQNGLTSRLLGQWKGAFRTIYRARVERDKLNGKRNARTRRTPRKLLDRLAR